MRAALFFGLSFLMVRTLSEAAPATPMPPRELLSDVWTAHWVTDDPAAPQAFGVRYFRKTFDLTQKPERFIVHVSADARYRLFVNGQSVCFGPQRSDKLVWRFESVDLSPWLRVGRNVVAAEVVSYGPSAPPYAIERLRFRGARQVGLDHRDGPGGGAQLRSVQFADALQVQGSAAEVR